MSPVVTDVQIKRNGVASVTVTSTWGDGHGVGHEVSHEDGDDLDEVVLPLETVVLHHLRRGNELTAEEWTEARGEGRRLLAVREALHLLSRRQRTRHELEQALTKSFAPDEATHAVERMGELGYLDDAAWARNYVQGPRAANRGRAALHRELSQRGIDQPIAALAVEAHDEREAAATAARKRARALRNIEEPKRSRRLYDFLRRRGFADGVAREAMGEALRQLDEGRTSDADEDEDDELDEE